MSYLYRLICNNYFFSFVLIVFISFATIGDTDLPCPGSGCPDPIIRAPDPIPKPKPKPDLKGQNPLMMSVKLT